MKVKTLNKNLLAFQIINDLAIYCSNMSKGCEWKGALDQATSHLPNCQFSEGKLPDWFNAYMVAWQEEQEKQLAVHELNDEETRDKLIEEADLPLSVRLYKKGNAVVNEQLNRAI